MFRYTFHFTDGQQGWSETFFRTVAMGAGDTIFMENYINRRLELLSSSIRMVSVRSSNTDSPRDISVWPFPNGGRGGAWGIPGATPSDPPSHGQAEDSFTALLLRLTDGSQHYRSFPLLGVPDHVYQYGIVVPSELPGFTAKLNNWISAISQANLGMKGQNGIAISGKIVEFPAKTEDNQLVCLGLKGAIPPVDSHVTLGSVKPFNMLNRTWRVSQTSGPIGAVDGYIYLAGTDDLNTYGPVQGGKYKVPTFTVYTLNAYSISRLTARRTGVPFDTVRGRR